jgi:copper transport protein
MGAMTRAATILAGAVVGCWFGALALAAPASAHAVLLRATPANGSVLASPPVEVTLTFSEGISAVPAKIRVIAPDGGRADSGAPAVHGTVLTIPLRGVTAKGTYLVTYRVISADSHPVAGAFSYSVGAPSALPTASEQGGTDRSVRAALAVARYAGYAGLVLIIGPALVLSALWPHRLSRRRPARLVWVGLGVTALGALAELVLQVPYEAGTRLGAITATGLRDVLGSTFGTVHLVRIGVLAVAGFLLRPVLAGRGGTGDRVLLAVLAVIGVATWPLAGHPAASPVPPVTVFADAAHLSAMAVWLGGLGMLLGFLLRQADEHELGGILPIWSRWAELAVATLIVAGTVQALVELGTPQALVQTPYGRLLVAKIVLSAAVVGVASVSRRLVAAGVAAGAPSRLRRLVGTELAVAAAVLAVASVLVQTTPGRAAQAGAEGGGAGPVSQVLTDPLYSLQVDVDPAQTGNNSLHLFAYTPDGTPVPVLEWKATAGLPAAAIDPLNVPLLKIDSNHAIGEVSLPTPGAWEFRFTLRISEVDQATVATTVQIR